MPPVDQDKPRDQVKKKTKSRNGCGRCKLKRLKCDETTPSCLQCRKRNVACPGYEKILKWSTKYEVFQPPVRFEKTDAGSKAKARSPEVSDVSLPQGVVDGFEALAAVLPIRKRRPGLGDETDARNESTQPNGSPGAQLSTVHDALSDSTTSPQETEATSIELTDAVDSTLLNRFGASLDVLDQDFAFDPGAENLDYWEPEPEVLADVDPDIEEVPRDFSRSRTASTSLASPQTSRSLLLDYYRIPSPSPSASVDDMESMLVQHYFKDVCVVFSSFDSILNPYRTSIGRVFQDSSSIFYAIQSMAAAHLANSFPNMTSIGIEMQSKAQECLQAELPLVQSGQMNGTTSFLSIILLGITTSWHESSALGQEFLTTARSLILPKLLCSSEREEVRRETQFFEESLIYWEMLMGFVTQDTISYSPRGVLRNRATPRPAPAARNKEGKIVPHPWTGIAPAIQLLFAEVGRLVRKERLLQMSAAIDFKSRSDNLLNAATLEEDLLEAEYPLADELADPGDEKTAKRDFIVIAEAYRCSGLLELYRVFPSLLRKRLGADTFAWTNKVDFAFPTPRFETRYEDTDTKLWINSLGLHVLDSLETLPASSGTCCLQPILLLTAASELKFVSSLDYFDIHANDARVLHSRKFAISRLNQYTYRLPAKPIRKVIDILQETWRRQDGGQDTFWIDVMVEKGWHTVMG